MDSRLDNGLPIPPTSIRNKSTLPNGLPIPPKKKDDGTDGSDTLTISAPIISKSPSPSIVSGGSTSIFDNKNADVAGSFNAAPLPQPQPQAVPKDNFTPDISNNFGLPSATDISKENSALKDNTKTISVPVLKRKNVLGEDSGEISEGQDEGIKLAKEYSESKKLLDTQTDILNSQILNTHQDVAVTKGDMAAPALFTPLPIKKEQPVVDSLDAEKNNVAAKADELRKETVKKAGVYAAKIDADATTAGLTTRAILGEKAAIQQSDFLEKGLPIAPSDLFYNDRQGLEALSAGVDEKYKDDLQNPEYIAKKQDIEKQSATLIDKYPEFKRQQISKIIAQEIMKEHPNVDGMAILPAAKQAVEKLGLTAEDIKNIDFDNLPIQSPISSAAGAIYNGIIGIGAGAGRILGTAVGMDKDVLTANLSEATRNAAARFEDVSNTQAAPTIVDADKKSPTYLQDVVNPEAGKYNYNFHTISNAIGQGIGGLAEFVGGTRVVGGVIKGIAPVVDATEAGMAGVMMLGGYEGHYQQARDAISDKPEDEWKRHAFSLINGSLDYLGFRVLGGVVKGIAPEAKDELVNIFKEAPSLAKVNRNALTKWTEKVIKGVEQTAGETAFVGGAQAGSELAKNIVINTIGTGEAAKKANKELGSVLLTGAESLPFAMAIPIGASKIIAGARGSYLYKENIYNAGLNPETYLGQANKLLHDGIITQDQFNQRAQVVNTAAKVVNSIPSDIELNHNQRVAYTNSKVRELALKAQAEKVDDAALEKFYNDQIKQEVDARTEILNGGSKEPAYVKPEADTKLSQPIEGVDEQGIPIGKNVPAPETNVTNETGTFEDKVRTLYPALKNTDNAGVNDFVKENATDTPSKFIKDFGEDKFNEVVDNISIPELKNKLKIVKQYTPDSEDVSILDKAISAKEEEAIYGKKGEPRVKLDFTEGKPIIESPKPISEMNSEEIGGYATEVRQALKQHEKEFANKTEKEKEDGGYYDYIDNVAELRDTEQRVNFVENSENLNDLANSTKSALRDFNKDNPSQESLAILNAAKIKAAEMNIEPETLIKEVLKKVGNDYKDKNDAEFMMRNYLEKIVPKEKQAEQQPIVNSNSEVPSKINADNGISLIRDESSVNDNANNYWYDVHEQSGKKIGNVEFNYREDLGGYQISNSKINESDQKKGIGTRVYKSLIQVLDKPLFSDSSRTESAEKLWKGLEKQGLAKYDEASGKYISENKPTISKEQTEPTKKEVEGVSSNSNEGKYEGLTREENDKVNRELDKTTVDNPDGKKDFVPFTEGDARRALEKWGLSKGAGNKEAYSTFLNRQFWYKSVPKEVYDFLNSRGYNLDKEQVNFSAKGFLNKQPTNERATTEVSPTIPTEIKVPKEQGNKEAVQPITESVGQGNAEAAPTVLKEGKYKAKAKKIADNIRQSELPSWLVNTDPTIKKSGVSVESLKNTFADAVELAGELLDKGVEVKDAIKQAADKIIDHILTDYPKGAKLKSDRESQIREGFENYYKDNILKGEEIKSDAGKGNKPPTEKEVIAQGEDNTIGIRHVDTAEMRQEKKLPEYEKKATTIPEMNEEADKRIKGGKMPELISKLEEGGSLSGGVEQAMMGKYIAKLDEVATANPTKENIASLDKAMHLNEVAGTMGFGQVGRMRQERFLPENSFGESLRDEAMSLHAKPEDLSKEVIEKVSQEHKEMEQLRKDLAKAEAANEKLKNENKAKLEVQKLIKEGRKSGKRDFKAERQSLKDKLKSQFADYKAAGNKLGITADGGAESFVISAKMAKTIADIVKSYADEGISKFDDLINKTFEDVKDVLGKVSKSDIIDVMAGVYNEKRPTKSELTLRMKDIRTEAGLLKELNNLRLKKEPATRRDKEKKNQRITDLENRIKEIRKNNNDETPVEKTEGERLAAKVKSMLKKIDEIQADVKVGKFEKEEPLPPVILDKKALAIQDRLIELEAQQAMRRAKQDYDELSKWDRSMDTFWQIAGLRRLINAAIDFSILFRQASPITLNPFKYIRIENGRVVKGTAPKAIINMFNLSFNPKGFKRFQYNIERTEIGRLFTHFDGTFSNPSEVRMEKREEEFTNSLLSRIGQKIEIGKSKNLKKAAEIADRVWFSERAAAALLNTIRVEEFSRDVRNYKRNGITPENNPKAYKDAVKWSMNMTGRGNMIKVLEDSHAGRLLANRTYFGARLMAAKINMLNPLTYARMEPKMRTMALKDMAGATTGFVMLALAGAAAGGAVSLNPDEPDFLQLRFGDKVFDLTGGSVAYVRTFLRFIKAIGGQVKNPGSKAANSYTTFAGKSIAKSLVVNKLSPNNAYLYHFWTRKSGQYDESGHLKPFDPYEIVRIYPMYIDGTISAYKNGGVGDALTIMMPDLFGIGTQQYNKKEKSVKGGGGGASSGNY